MILNDFLKSKLKITCPQHMDLVRPFISGVLDARMKKMLANTKSRYRSRLTTRGEQKECGGKRKRMTT